jgi:hypothetical protein
MPRDQVILNELDPLRKKELPQSPLVPIQLIRPEEPEVAQFEGAIAPFVPQRVKKERLVQFGCKLPLSLRERLEELAKEYDTDMTGIVVELLDMHLPKSTRKKH